MAKTQASRDEAYKRYVDSGYKDESARQAMGASQSQANDVTKDSAGNYIQKSVNKDGTSTFYQLDGYGGSSSGSTGGSYGSSPKSSYQNALTDYNDSVLDSAARAKQDALRQAWEGNEQALNSQKSTVANNYNSAANKLNAVRDARLPEFQQQRNMASADASQMALRNKELMAATGRSDSGYNRTSQTAIDLNRNNAISGYMKNENDFKTDVGNQLSDIDSQRVAALNDIAEKLSLGKKQYNDGTLSLTNQLESDKASGALKAFLEAQTRADTLSQQNYENSFRDKQFEQSASLAELQQQFQEKQFQAEQDAQLWEQQFRQQGFSADESYRMSQLQLQKDTQAAENAYRNAALAASSVKSSSSSSKPTAAETAASIKKETASATADAFDRLNELANQGQTRSQILKAFKNNYSTYANGGADMDALYKLIDEQFQWDG